MKVLHITPDSIGYEIVELIANRVSKTNGLAVIEKDNNQFITGGFLLNDTAEIRKILDDMPINKQYDFIKSLKIDPFAKSYYEE